VDGQTGIDSDARGTAGGRPAVAVFAPSPVVTVTVERGRDDYAEVHFHAGGQGFWVARMAAVLGADVTLIAPLGGEPGRVLAGLLSRERLSVRHVETGAWTGVYVHDRRSGEREVVAETASARLHRHESDDLYGAALATGLEAGVLLLTGPREGGLLDPDVYRRLAVDLRVNGCVVAADLTGEPLHAALSGGVDLVKLNDQEALAERLCSDDSTECLCEAVQALRDAGATSVLVTRGAEGAIGIAEGRLIELVGPRFTAIDPSGAGDSMFAALGVGLARRQPLIDSLRLAVAAGALNATRHGLGSGHQSEIDAMAKRVSVRPLERPGEQPLTAPSPPRPPVPAPD
jgi:1-phosphofructokinase